MFSLANSVIIGMESYHIETLMPKDGNLILSGLPFKKGEKLDITLRTVEHYDVSEIEEFLAGSVGKYINPAEPVADDEWEALQ